MSRPALADPYYRWVDRLSKLAGVVLVAVGLEVGGASPTGLALGILGAAVAVSTVFIHHRSTP